MAREPLTPLVYDVIEPTSPQTTVIDVLVGAGSVVLAIVFVAILLGLGLAGLLIVRRRVSGEGLDGRGGQGITLGLDTRLRPIAPSREAPAPANGAPPDGGETSPPGHGNGSSDSSGAPRRGHQPAARATGH